MALAIRHLHFSLSEVCLVRSGKPRRKYMTTCIIGSALFYTTPDIQSRSSQFLKWTSCTNLNWTNSATFLRPMGGCCSSVRNETRVEPCQGHHSFYIHPEGSFSNNTYNVVYRPPHLNERLAPGEAKPRFWVNPSNSLNGPAVVSVAWCELCQPLQPNLPRLSNTKRPNKMKHAKVDTCKFRSDESMEGGKGIQGQEVMTCGDNCMLVKAYPQFLLPYINKCIRLRLVFLDPKVEQLVGEYGHLKHGKETEVDPMMETSHIVRNMHSLKVYVTYSTVVQGLPEVTVDENHGGVKRLKRVRYRRMPVTWIDLDHRKSSITIVGEQFELTLGPPCPLLTPEDFPDGNGEMPLILGTYTRALDTCHGRQLHFSARLYRWFNQSAHSEGHYDAGNPIKPPKETGGCDMETDI